jgi:hypothetical protein
MKQLFAIISALLITIASKAQDTTQTAEIDSSK